MGPLARSAALSACRYSWSLAGVACACGCAFSASMAGAAFLAAPATLAGAVAGALPTSAPLAFLAGCGVWAAACCAGRLAPAAAAAPPPCCRCCLAGGSSSLSSSPLSSSSAHRGGWATSERRWSAAATGQHRLSCSAGRARPPSHTHHRSCPRSALLSPHGRRWRAAPHPRLRRRQRRGNAAAGASRLEAGHRSTAARFPRPAPLLPPNLRPARTLHVFVLAVLLLALLLLLLAAGLLRLIIHQRPRARLGGLAAAVQRQPRRRLLVIAAQLLLAPLLVRRACEGGRRLSGEPASTGRWPACGPRVPGRTRILQHGSALSVAASTAGGPAQRSAPKARPYSSSSLPPCICSRR